MNLCPCRMCACVYSIMEHTLFSSKVIFWLSFAHSGWLLELGFTRGIEEGVWRRVSLSGLSPNWQEKIRQGLHESIYVCVCIHTFLSSGKLMFMEAAKTGRGGGFFPWLALLIEGKLRDAITERKDRKIRARLDMSSWRSEANWTAEERSPYQNQPNLLILISGSKG